MGSLPLSWVSPFFMAFQASPQWKSPMSSELISSRMLNASWISATFTSDGMSPAVWNAILAAIKECGFDAVALNEHHGTPFCMGSVMNVEAAILARITSMVKIVLVGNPLPVIKHPLRMAEELAEIDLISRGHRFVADDVVEVSEVSPLTLKGRSPDLTQHHMEIHGLGIINVRELFGTLATLDEQPVDLVVELVEWSTEIDRLGLEDQRYTILHVSVPLIQLPVRPGRNLAMLIEVAARNQILKARGQHAARQFATMVDRQIRRTARLHRGAPAGGRS
jgi:hypothetical protein